MMIVRAVIMSLLLMSSAAMAQDQQQQEPKKDDTLEKAGDIAVQPAKDVGIAKTKIPPVLQRAVEAPYALPKARSCKAINADIAELTAALGPDFGTGTEENENRTGKILEAGGKTIVNTLIPFRGLVREVTGAAPAQRRLEAAISTGMARRGFLRGYGKAKGCKAPA
jgi:hypothetical protein